MQSMMQRTNPSRSVRPGPNAFVGQEGPGHGWSRKLPGDEYAPDEMFKKCTHVAEREWDSYLLRDAATPGRLYIHVADSFPSSFQPSCHVMSD